MDHFVIEGTLYQIETLAPSGGGDFQLECWDMTPESGGLVGLIRLPVGGEAIIELTRPLPVSVLMRWLQEVPKWATKPKT
jgi:hypothetical protein